MNFIKKYAVLIVIAFVICIFIKPALCFLILGSLVSCVGFATIIFLQKIKKRGTHWTGKIVEYQSDSDGYKIPLIEFTTITGEVVRAKPFVYASTDLSKFRTYSKFVDQTVPIVYDPDNPQRFVLKNEEGFNYFIFILLILAGLFFVGLSIAWLVGYINMS